MLAGCTVLACIDVVGMGTAKTTPEFAMYAMLGLAVLQVGAIALDSENWW